MHKLFCFRHVGFAVLAALGLAPFVSSCIDLKVDSGSQTLCGDGALAEAELCDDGNQTNGDGCDSNCTPTSCGNGIVTSGEACDDGNTDATDGCSNFCTKDVCGDGKLTGVEECDDGNFVGGDGCDANCTMTFCGNGAVTDGEECDDANQIDGDGCDSNCYLTRCGNGIVTVPEECDDGNTRAGDGCGVVCTLENHDGCSGPKLEIGLETVVITGNTQGAMDDINTSAMVNACMAGTWAAPDLIYPIMAKASGTLNVSLTPAYTNGFVHLRTACPGTAAEEVGCAFAAMGTSSFSAMVTAGSVYFVIADGWNNKSGSFTLTLTLQ